MILQNLSFEIQIDLENKTVTVEAGIRVYKLNEELWKDGLALSNLGSISDQSISGAISTTTHGSSINFGNMSTQVHRICHAIHNFMHFLYTILRPFSD